MTRAANPSSLPRAPSDEGAARERRLVERARAGDREAFREIHHRFHPMVHAILLASLTREEAEDLAQEVFLAAWSSIATLRDDEHFGGWLATIARNRARRRHARAKPSPAALPPDLQSARGAPHEAAEILGVLHGLPECYRETLVMRLVEGMSGPEISERTGLTPGSVRVNLCRGMALLREALSERGWS